MLELVNVCFSVKEKGRTKDILKNINLKIEDDKFFVITGPNGSGKSTLAKVIMGINKVTSGKILFNGEDITDLGVTERAKLGISFAFQQPVRFKGITVKKMIELATGGEITVGDACKYLADVGLCARDYIDREVDTSLSGGELKRIEIASTVARNSKLTVFDEPEAGIDLWSFNSLIKTFNNLKNKYKCGFVIISHQERILDIADQVIVISNGEIKKIGSKAEILPNLAEIYSACSVLEEAN
ncbi:MAG: ATP-binding cassette domain-containing protein [Clostridia bacterium]|nr:ATP-binding cassette domain-containing protein [Clostridia bacterium]